jgi:hypothetical protein
MKSHLQVDDPRQESDPANASSLRRSEFARLLRLPETRGYLFGAVVGAGILALLINRSTAWVLPALALLVGPGVVLWIADRNAARQFWETYARVRGYELGDPYVSELFLQARRGPHPMRTFGDRLHRGRREVVLESEALADRLEILVGESQDELWTRRLLNPAFIVWLAESTPRELSAELEDGTLVAYLPGHKEDAEDLDSLAAAAGEIARRLLEESAQTSRGTR